jgi:hypothetical protein
MSLFNDIKTVLEQDPNAYDAVRRVLRNTKSKHKEANTRDPNANFHIPGYKFIKREGVLILVKDGGVPEEKYLKPKMDVSSFVFGKGDKLLEKEKNVNKYKNEMKNAETQVLDAESEEEEEEDESLPTQASILPQGAGPTVQTQKLNINDELKSLARIHALQKAQQKAEEEAKVISQSLLNAPKITQTDTEDERQKERLLKQKEEELLKEFLRQKEEEQRHEQKSREKSQLREKQEREQKMKEQYRQPRCVFFSLPRKTQRGRPGAEINWRSKCPLSCVRMLE